MMLAKSWRWSNIKLLNLIKISEKNFKTPNNLLMFYGRIHSWFYALDFFYLGVFGFLISAILSSISFFRNFKDLKTTEYILGFIILAIFVFYIYWDFIRVAFIPIQTLPPPRQ